MTFRFPKSKLKNIYILLFFVLSHNFYAQQYIINSNHTKDHHSKANALPVKTNPGLKWLAKKETGIDSNSFGSNKYTMNADSVWVFSKAKYRDDASGLIKAEVGFTNNFSLKFKSFNSTNSSSINTSPINADVFLLASYNDFFQKRFSFAVPPTTITGNFNICFPTPGTSQLTGSGLPAAVNPWVSSNPGAVSVNSTGLVTGLMLGAATITYTDILGNQDSKNVFVTANPTISGTLTRCVGGTTTLTGSGTPHAITPWNSLNPAIATVNSAGVVTGVSGGIASIVYQNSNGCTATAMVTINPLIVPVITCGAASTTQVTFNWSAVSGASTYTLSYNINSTGSVFVGNIGNVLTYTLPGLSPADSVAINLTPSGAVGTCFASASQTCVTASCTPGQLPAAPIVAITQPTCTLATGDVTITPVAGITYRLDSGLYSGTLFYSGLAPGPHSITAINAFACTAVTNFTINPQPLTPAAPAYTVTQPTCTVATGTVSITGVAGETYSLDALPYSATLTYPGLAAGTTHTITARNAAGCISSVTNVPAINAQPLTPAIPAVAITQPTCTVATADITITGVAGETYSLDALPFSAALFYGGLIAGSSHTVTARNAAGCTAVANVSINTQPLTPAAPAYTVTQPTCTVATGTVSITGVAGETYSLDALPYSAMLTYPGLAAGTTHTITARNAAGCISSVTNVPAIGAQPLTPAAPAYTVTQPTCTVATGTVSITGVAGETYSLDALPYSATLTYPGLAAGTTHTITARNAAGCISSVTNVPAINAQPLTPAAPAYTVTQPTCTVATGTVSITGVAGETYSLDALPYSATLTYPGLAAGTTHTITARNAAGCISSVTNVPAISAQPLTPAAPAYTVTQPTCTVATGTVSITGVAGETYSLDALPYSATLTYPGLAAGTTHTITARNAAGCISSVTNVPAINAQPLTPAAPAYTVTQPTCTVATGTVSITGVAGETYSLDALPYSATLTYPGLAAGTTHTITARNAAGCISSVTNVPAISAQPLTPAAPAYTVTQPTCTVATGTVSITGVAGETYSLDALPYSATLTYPGLAAGTTHTITARNAAGCISSVTNVPAISAQPLTPAAPAYTVTQPTCTVATGTVSITGVAGETYSLDALPYSATLTYPGLAAGTTHTITARNAAGCISSVTNVPAINAQPLTPAIPAVAITQPTCTVATADITITGVAGETYSLDALPFSAALFYGGLIAGSSHTVTARNAAGCTAVANVSINTQPLTPAAPAYTVTQPTCTVATGTVSITGVAGETYSLDALPYSAMLTYPGLAAGTTHTITARNAAGCISSVTNVPAIGAQPLTPAAPAYTVTQPTCTVATGTVSITGVAGETYSLDALPYSATLTYPGLAAGTTHTITARNAAGCISSVTNVPAINAQPLTPAAPAYTVTQPTCTVATGTVSITGVAGETYSLDALPYSATLTYPGLAAGTTHTITARNAAGCISSVTNVPAISAQPLTPAAPAYTVTQPTCTVATGTVSITGVAGETYSLDALPYSATLTYPGLAAGTTHTITARNAAGCISSVTNVPAINAQPLTPAAPAYTVTQPTCTVATGTVSITGVAGETYSLDALPYSATLTYPGLAAGTTHTITARNAAGCISSVTNVPAISAQPLTPAAPAYTVTQPTCTVATGTVSITGVAGETYSLDALPYSATLTYPGLAAGTTHTITARNAAGCISSVTNVPAISAQPLTPAAPAYTVTQPTCTVATGTVSITGVAGETYSLDALPYSATLTYPGLAAGTTHTITARNAAGCISSVTNVPAINAQPLTPAIPAVAITQPTCTVATADITITGVAGETYSLDALPFSAALFYGGLIAGSSHTVTARNAAGCTAVANVSINTQPLTPAAPAYTVTQPTCTVATGTVSITGVAGETYSLDALPYSATLTYPGLAAGTTHTITARNAAGCISSVTNVPAIGAQPLTPAAPAYTVTQPTCTVATGTVSITGVAGETYSLDALPYSATLTYPGLAAGTTHTITARNAAGCISSVTNVPAINAQPLTPAAPAYTVTQPTCTVATGTVSITGVAGETYSLDALPYSATLTYPGLAAGTTHTITARNAAGCISSVTNVPAISAQPLTPAAPAYTVTQPTCTVATGTVSITGVAGETYSLDALPYSATLTYPGLAAGTTHTITARNAAGCISSVTNVPAINAQPLTPAAPAYTVTQPTCTVATGTVSITGVAGETYSLDALPYSATLTYPGLAAGTTHTITARNAAGCISSVTNVPAISAQPLTPAAPAYTVTQPTCTVATGTVSITGVAGETYSLDALPYSATLTYPGLAAGTTHTITARNAAGCISSVTNVPAISAQPLTPVVTATPANQSICTGSNTNIVLSSNITGTTFNWTVIQNNANGAISGTGNFINQALTITGTSTGTVTYTVTPTNSNGCVGNPIDVIITVNPLPAPTLSDGIICVDQSTGTTLRSYILNTGLNNSTYDFAWYQNGNNISGASDSIYETNVPGVYSVIATNTATGCISIPVSATVTESFTGQTITATSSEAFSNNPMITVNVTPANPLYLYQLDGGAFQSSNVFSPITPGVHTIVVNDSNGCTYLTAEVLIIDYPKYFTPNGDGIHDTWNIIGLSDQPNAKIYIFDRYGKFIEQINPGGIGWDGNSNGNELPSTDYWFSVEFLDNLQPKVFKSHFALKR